MIFPQAAIDRRQLTPTKFLRVYIFCILIRLTKLSDKKNSPLTTYQPSFVHFYRLSGFSRPLVHEFRIFYSDRSGAKMDASERFQGCQIATLSIINKCRELTKLQYYENFWFLRYFTFALVPIKIYELI